MVKELERVARLVDSKIVDKIIRSRLTNQNDADVRMLEDQLDWPT